MIKAKKEANKMWETSGRQEDKDRYRQANKAPTKVATAKARAMNELYEELEPPKGERSIFRIAKARDKAIKYITHIKLINYEQGVVLRYLQLLNEDNRSSVFEDGVPTEGLALT